MRCKCNLHISARHTTRSESSSAQNVLISADLGLTQVLEAFLTLFFLTVFFNGFTQLSARALLFHSWWKVEMCFCGGTPGRSQGGTAASTAPVGPLLPLLERPWERFGTDERSRTRVRCLDMGSALAVLSRLEQTL